MNWNIEKSSSDPKQNIAGETDENWWFIKDVVERYASVCLNRMEIRNILIVSSHLSKDVRYDVNLIWTTQLMFSIESNIGGKGLLS